MTDIARLADSFRQQATEYSSECKQSAYNHCAEQVEQAWHDHAHDGEWDPACPLCQKEQEGVAEALGAEFDDDGHRRP